MTVPSWYVKSEIPKTLIYFLYFMHYTLYNRFAYGMPLWYVKSEIQKKQNNLLSSFNLACFILALSLF